MGRAQGTATGIGHPAHIRVGVILASALLAVGCGSGDSSGDQDPAEAATASDTPPAVAVRESPPDPAAADPSPSPSPTPSSSPRKRLPKDFELALEEIADGLEQPVSVTAPPGDPRLFVVEKTGRVRIIEDGRIAPTPFLDIRRKVRAGGPTSEQGMFALAFHPGYASNGRLFVHYTARPDGDTRVVEYRVSGSDPNRADVTTRRTILKVNQPFRWHNGGMMTFGPDGMLWLGLGDGGVKGDPDDHGQNPRTLLGSILRVDVDRRAGDKAYGIPPDNPFADGEDGAPEVWAYGLRNPWRFDIDPRRNLLFVADVGEYAFEEINVISLDRAGRNFGWAVREGDECFAGRSAECTAKGFVDPVMTYEHGGDSCAVVGGVVYRGQAMPELGGRFLYADFCDGRIRSFRYNRRGKAVERRDWSEQVGRLPLLTSFGMDADGELYVTSAEGTVHRVVRAPD
jgi:glucose/arabinose dehydrogenase